MLLIVSAMECFGKVRAKRVSNVSGEFKKEHVSLDVVAPLWEQLFSIHLVCVQFVTTYFPICDFSYSRI